MKQIIDSIWNMPANQFLFTIIGVVIAIFVIWMAFIAWIIYKDRF